MQTKKDDVRDKLIDAGLKNFSEFGFAGASIRVISKDAGTTLGNFYNYFESKLALFDEIVKYEYQAFIDFINKHKESQEAVDLESLDPETLLFMLKNFVENIMPTFTDRFLLILSKSAGTTYENARPQLENLIKSHYLDHVREMEAMHYDEGFADLLTHQFLDSMIYILEQKISEYEKKRLMSKMFLYMFMGIASIMEKFPSL